MARPEGMRVGFDPENEESEVLSLYLGEGDENHLVVNVFDLAGAMARLEDGNDQDPFFSPTSAEGISGDTVEADTGPEVNFLPEGFSPESSVPTEAAYMAAEVEPGGLMLLRRILYPGEDTLEITCPTGAVYTFDYKEVVNYFRPILPR